MVVGGESIYLVPPLEYLEGNLPGNPELPTPDANTFPAVFLDGRKMTKPHYQPINLWIPPKRFMLANSFGNQIFHV